MKRFTGEYCAEPGPNCFFAAELDDGDALLWGKTGVSKFYGLGLVRRSQSDRFYENSHGPLTVLYFRYDPAKKSSREELFDGSKSTAEIVS